MTRFVGAAVIFLTLISTAVVVAQSCHDEPTSVVATTTVTHASHGDHIHSAVVSTGTFPDSAQGVLNGGLLSDICTGIFYLVLFFGGRFLLKSGFSSFKNQIVFFKTSYVFPRPNVALNLSLSLPQLGICRI